MEITKRQIESLNKDILKIQTLNPKANLFTITDDMNITQSGVSRLVFMDRYTYKDTERITLKKGDIVILTVRNDPEFPARGLGTITYIKKGKVTIKVDDEYLSLIDPSERNDYGTVKRNVEEIDKPLELFYEQTAKRVSFGLAEVEKNSNFDVFREFEQEMKQLNVVPAGRVLYGAGSGTEVTMFNCFVMPYIKDSRGGISRHREKVMEIMSRGGGVGTNGSTLRPRNTLAKGVNGRSSGSVSWLNDIANLTHLVEQGGSRRGAQMLMLADWHPDILEFIISKMQNPDILRLIIDTIDDEQIKQLAKDKLKFTPLSNTEKNILEASLTKVLPQSDEQLHASKLLEDGGRWSVNNPNFLTGANISVCITKEFMKAVKNDGDYELRFPDIDNYTHEQKFAYNQLWEKCGDVREWHKKGFPVRTHRTIKAKTLWNLINICATYSAEPGIFFIDNANEMTNATAYGQKVVATNPCVTGDTMIKTVEGEKSVFELVESNQVIDVYTMNHDETLTIRKAYDFRKTQENVDVFEIKTHRGESVKVTSNHPVYVQGKGWLEAKDISIGDRLVVLQTKKSNERYLKIKLSSEKQYRLEHRFIAGHYDDIDGMDVHHEDENFRNNVRSNLKVLTHAGHSVLTNSGKPCKADRCCHTGRFLPSDHKMKKENIPFDNGLENPCACPTVKSIEYVGKEDVYNFEVEDTHNYIANRIVVHNCGEQPLAPYSVCNLLAINLSNMVKGNKLDADKLAKSVKTAVRMGDNVIDATPYFLEENKKQALGERRIGLGVMGLHDLLIKCEKVYGSKEGNKLVDLVFQIIATEAYRESIALAKEKGSFPFLNHDDGKPNFKKREAFIESGYMKNMPEDIRQGILEHGIRNSHLLTVAPTGSTGTFIGCSTGLEPYFSFSYYRSGRLGKNIEVKADIVQEYLNEHSEADPDNLPEWFVSSMDLSPEAHADTQCVIQRWVDSSISKTVNAPEGYSVDQVQNIYERLYNGGAKGGTVYVDGSRDSQVLSLKKEKDKKPVVNEEVKPLRQTSVSTKNNDDKICPACHEGTLKPIAGCETCDQCGFQTKCGL